MTLKVPLNKIELKISIGAMVNLTAKMKVMNKDVKLLFGVNILYIKTSHCLLFKILKFFVLITHPKRAVLRKILAFWISEFIDLQKYVDL